MQNNEEDVSCNLLLQRYRLKRQSIMSINWKDLSMQSIKVNLFKKYFLKHYLTLKNLLQNEIKI